MKTNKLMYVLPVLLMVVAVGTFSMFGGKVSADDHGYDGLNLGLGLGSGFNQKSNKEDARLNGSTLEVHIADNGTVLVRGAKVTAVSGNTISATTAWGAMNLNWTVNVSPSTHLWRKLGSTSFLAEMSVGDLVSFQGAMTASSNSTITVNATTVKNWSIQKKNVRSSMQGTVKSVAGASLPTSMVVTTDGTDHTVNLSGSTSVVNNAWLNVSIGSFAAGNNVVVYGVVSPGTTVNATVVRNLSQ